MDLAFQYVGQILGSYYIELIAAMILLFHFFEKKRLFALRLSVFLLGTALISAVVIYITSGLLISVAGMEDHARYCMLLTFYYALGRLAIYLICGAGSALIYDCPFRTRCFFIVAMHAMECVAYSINSVVLMNHMFQLAYYLIDIAIYAAFYIVFAKFIENAANSDNMNFGSVTALYLITVIAMLITEGAGFVYRIDSYEMFIFLNIMQLLCAITILFVQFFMIGKLALEKDIALLDYIRGQEREQHELSRQNIELINLKCHDLKHQILRLRNDETDEGYLKELTEAISIYDTFIRTGNPDLDMIFTEKNFICSSKNIFFTAIVDGAALDFMSKSDLYSLFCNAIDNAIEYVSNIDEEKRFIKVNAGAMNGFVSIQFRNYYEGDGPQMADGLPVTTKGDNGYHGFGMKSMRHICESYGGTLGMEIVGKEFIVSALIPTCSCVKHRSLG